MSHYKFTITVPIQVSVPSLEKPLLDRENFYDWLWHRFGDAGLAGVHEGTLLCDEAAKQGFETDSWTVDSAEAPRERDWIGHQKEVRAELYFSTQSFAQQAWQELGKLPDLVVGEMEEQQDQDWDAQWKATFLNAGEGVRIPPFWRVVPPWSEGKPDEQMIKINPGAGFGTGTHETTQLCLQALGEKALSSGRDFLKDQRTLDFGSGSGILAIGMAQLGAKVDAVEIDPLALDNALDNAQLNGVEGKIRFSKSLPEETQYRVVIANILRPVLLEYVKALTGRLSSGGTLILSGLIESDVEPILQVYQPILGEKPGTVYKLGEWRAIVF